jgi:tetratricopeptide (TPR) repeat protein
MSLSEEARDLIRRGMAFHQSGQFPEAQQCYEQVLGQDPRNVDASHLLGVLKAARGEIAEALRLIQVAVDGAPTSPMILLNYGNALSAAGQRQEALAMYDKALVVQSDNYAAWFNKGNLLKTLGRPLDALAGTVSDAAVAFSTKLVRIRVAHR